MAGHNMNELCFTVAAWIQFENNITFYTFNLRIFCTNDEFMKVFYYI